MTTEIIVIEPSASIVPISTKVREYFMDSKAEIKKVLSPISLAKTRTNDAVNPAIKPAGSSARHAVFNPASVAAAAGFARARAKTARGTKAAAMRAACRARRRKTGKDKKGSAGGDCTGSTEAGKISGQTETGVGSATQARRVERRTGRAVLGRRKARWTNEARHVRCCAGAAGAAKAVANISEGCAAVPVSIRMASGDNRSQSSLESLVLAPRAHEQFSKF
jgi:hypothetical protein